MGEALTSRAVKDPTVATEEARALVATPPVSTLPSEELLPSDEETELVDLMESPRWYDASSEPQSPLTPKTFKKTSEAYPSACVNETDREATLSAVLLPKLPGSEGMQEELPFSPLSLTADFGRREAPGSRLGAPPPSP